jgi:anti-sigma B factor antagonist
MELKVIKSDPRCTHIALAGKLDVAGEQEIGDEFRRLIDTRRTSFLVDMSQVAYLASLGIRLLFAGAKSLAEDGCKLVVVKPQPMVEETLLNSGTAKLIPISRSEEEALGLL